MKHQDEEWHRNLSEQEKLKIQVNRETMGKRARCSLSFLLSEWKIDDIIKVGYFALTVRKLLMKGNK